MADSAETELRNQHRENNGLLNLLSLMKRIIAVLGLIVAGCSCFGETRDAFHWNALIGRGVNLGNALEAPKEGQWGVTLREEYFGLIREAGFDSVRIPVRWSAHAKREPPYTIDSDFMKRVEWAVEQALDRQLVAILDMHHYKEMESRPRAEKERFLALWKQISEHYRESPATLYFELMNEPCREMTSKLWNDYAVEAIGAIRKTNPRRAIVVGPVQWNNATRLKGLKLPEDDRNLIVTFHNYRPFKFTHQGAGWVGDQSKKWLGTKWAGTDSQKKEVREYLDIAADWGESRNRPLFMGEFGAYSKADMALRARWTEFVRREAEKRGFSWAYWEFCAGFGVYDPDTNRWKHPLRKALLGSTER